MFERRSIDLLRKALDDLERGFDHLPPVDGDEGEMEQVLLEVSRRMRENYPYFHPLYAGQMLKPPHPIARAAYMLSLWINPNNHALDGGYASSQMEKEAVAELASLFGWREHLGHLTGGGTMANMEALWVSGKLRKGEKVVASEQAHYTHSRLSEVLGLDFRSIPCDRHLRMDIGELEELLRREEVGTVVATIGTTGTGSVDPLPEILDLRRDYGFRLHADAAYGGYFTLVDELDVETREAMDRLGEVDSIVIDPHKHGLQPYGCGCVLFRDPGVGRFYRHDSPYTYFTSSDLHLGEISLECSRPGASAVALWATQRLLPLERGGEFSADLTKCREAALDLYGRIEAHPDMRTILPPELDIVVFAPEGEKASEISDRSRRWFKEAEENDLNLAAFKLPSSYLEEVWPEVEFDRPDVTCLRSCLMKPEHLDWMDRIWERLVGSLPEAP
ncbi:MAG: pyridoxal phosphate-dependent decarboxylase family protein [Methanomassiliicoccales archaeon]